MKRSVTRSCSVKLEWNFLKQVLVYCISIHTCQYMIWAICPVLFVPVFHIPLRSIGPACAKETLAFFATTPRIAVGVWVISMVFIACASSMLPFYPFSKEVLQTPISFIQIKYRENMGNLSNATPMNVYSASFHGPSITKSPRMQTSPSISAISAPRLCQDTTFLLWKKQISTERCLSSTPSRSLSIVGTPSEAIHRQGNKTTERPSRCAVSADTEHNCHRCSPCAHTWPDWTRAFEFVVGIRACDL